MANQDFEIGDWVQVYGQVKYFPNTPENVKIAFFAKVDSPWVDVRKDTVQKCDPPSHATRCDSLAEEPGSEKETYVRCQSHLYHAGKHKHGDFSWTDESAAAKVEL